MPWSDIIPSRKEGSLWLAHMAHLGRRAATLERRAHARYEASVEAWVVLADRFYADGGRMGRVISRAAFESPLVAPESKALVRLTLGLLLAVAAWVLVSCASRPVEPRARREAPPARVARPERRPDTLYLKRETLKIKPKDEGSVTGSIWADTDGPRQLLADERPRKAGEVITVRIPEEMRFVPPGGAGRAGPAASGGNKGNAKGTMGAGAKGGAGEAPQAQAANEAKTADPKAAAGKPSSGATGAGAAGGAGEDPTFAFTDPYRTGVLGALDPTPVSSLKMQLVGVEPGGDAYLRGTKRYQNGLGETRDVTVFAKVPARLLTSFELDARDLSEVALTEQVNGQSVEYASTGWDAAVSRKLSGFAPDVEAELQALEEVREELGVAQASVKDQMKAMADERARVQKDRRRAFEESERLKEALRQAKEQANEQAAGRASDGAASGGGNETKPEAQGTAPAGQAMDKAASAAQGAGK